MPNKIADFFGQLGFKVDPKGLERFRKDLKALESEAHRAGLAMNRALSTGLTQAQKALPANVILPAAAAAGKPASAKTPLTSPQRDQALAARKGSLDRLKQHRAEVREVERVNKAQARTEAKNLKEQAQNRLRERAQAVSANQKAMVAKTRSQAIADRLEANRTKKAHAEAAKLKNLEAKDASKISKSRLAEHQAAIRDQAKSTQAAQAAQDRAKAAADRRHAQTLKSEAATQKSLLKTRLSEHKKVVQGENLTEKSRLKTRLNEHKQEIDSQRRVLRERAKAGKKEGLARKREDSTDLRKARQDAEAYAKSLGQLRDKLDPLSAASARYKRDVALLETGLRKGSLTNRQYRDSLSALSAKFNQVQSQALNARAGVKSFTATVNESARGLRNFGLLAGITFSGVAGFEILTDMQKIKNGLLAAAGTAKQAAADFGFLRDESGRLGVSIREISKDFVKFSASTVGTALEGAKAKDVFTAVLEASRALGLSTEDTSGSLRALGQMLSKSTVQAEELRGQLGDRIPGAFKMAARAMGLTTEELNKQLKAGQVLAVDLLPKLAIELRRLAAAGLLVSTGSVVAELQRLGNALFEMVSAAGEGGFLNTLASIFKGMTVVVRALTPTMFALGFALDLIMAPLRAIGILLIPVVKLLASLPIIVEKLITGFNHLPPTLKTITTALIGLALWSKRAAIQMGLMWLAGLAPLVLTGAAVGALALLFEDLATAMAGGESAIANAAKSGNGFIAFVAKSLLVVGELISLWGVWIGLFTGELDLETAAGFVRERIDNIAKIMAGVFDPLFELGDIFTDWIAEQLDSLETMVDKMIAKLSDLANQASFGLVGTKAPVVEETTPTKPKGPQRLSELASDFAHGASGGIIGESYKKAQAAREHRAKLKELNQLATQSSANNQADLPVNTPEEPNKSELATSVLKSLPSAAPSTTTNQSTNHNTKVSEIKNNFQAKIDISVPPGTPAETTKNIGEMVRKETQAAFSEMITASMANTPEAQ